MRVLMLSWEYPPQIIGGMGRHVDELTRTLARQGVEIHVICPGDNQALAQQLTDGVHVYRVPPYSPSTPDFISQVIQMNVGLLERASSLIYTLGSVDLVHAHDWLVAYASRALKHAYQIPLVATIHATEFGRNNGLHTDQQRYIGSVEWWLTYEAWRVICCSYYMQDELQRVFHLPADKIELISNGIDLEDFQVNDKLINHLSAFRCTYAQPDEKIVFCISRLVHEKGVQVLLDAVPRVLAAYPATKFIIAGRGPNQSYLQHKAQQMGVDHRVNFIGFIDDQTRNCLYRVADVTVIPSLYEPFGIVVLEGMAAGCPVVVSDTGGVSEIIEHRVDGLKAQTGSAESLAGCILEILNQPEFGNSLKEKAYQKVIGSYSWDIVARKTTALYRQVLKARTEIDWPVNHRVSTVPLSKASSYLSALTKIKDRYLLKH